MIDVFFDNFIGDMHAKLCIKMRPKSAEYYGLTSDDVITDLPRCLLSNKKDYEQIRIFTNIFGTIMLEFRTYTKDSICYTFATNILHLRTVGEFWRLIDEFGTKYGNVIEIYQHNIGRLKNIEIYYCSV